MRYDGYGWWISLMMRWDVWRKENSPAAVEASKRNTKEFPLEHNVAGWTKLISPTMSLVVVFNLMLKLKLKLVLRVADGAYWEGLGTAGTWHHMPRHQAPQAARA